jgi:hypothetical protein
MKLCLRFVFLFVVVLLTLGVAPAAQNANQTANPLVPTVTFNCLWEAATPQEYTITVKSTGTARYLSRNPTKPPDANGVGDEDYVIEFTMSAANVSKVFALTGQARYFDGPFDYTRHAIANTGKKTLTYADPARHFQTTYNWSENTAIDGLTNLFGAISNTMEHGRKLLFLRRFDKLGLEGELKAMEHLAQNQELAELEVIAPTLENIANDSSVLNIARQRARRLLALANKESGSTSLQK